MKLSAIFLVSILFLMVIINSTCFLVRAQTTEYLYVNAFDSTYAGWTILGVSPYIDAVDTTSVIRTKAAGIEGWFDFPSTTFSGTLTVNAEIYNLQWGGDILVEFEWTGDATPEDTIQVTGSISTWYDLGTVSGLDSDSEVNACRVRFTWAAAKNAWLEVDAFRLYVEAEADDDLSVELPETINVVDSLETFKRIFSYQTGTTSATSIFYATKNIYSVNEATIIQTESNNIEKNVFSSLSSVLNPEVSIGAAKKVGFMFSQTVSSIGTFSLTKQIGTILSETTIASHTFSLTKHITPLLFETADLTALGVVTKQVGMVLSLVVGATGTPMVTKQIGTILSGTISGSEGNLVTKTILALFDNLVATVTPGFSIEKDMGYTFLESVLSGNILPETTFSISKHIGTLLSNSISPESGTQTTKNVGVVVSNNISPTSLANIMKNIFSPFLDVISLESETFVSKNIYSVFDDAMATLTGSMNIFKDIPTESLETFMFDSHQPTATLYLVKHIQTNLPSVIGVSSLAGATFNIAMTIYDILLSDLIEPMSQLSFNWSFGDALNIDFIVAIVIIVAVLSGSTAVLIQKFKDND